ncbi:tRNA(Ile)-lysidine synthetase [Gemella bergeri ATCC 700627]|uniref:tRNA(Ile)-lysidine synthase n=1 Tax=Gemella bergeri ATCC 700627 TaxID=1321820 RepID=U2Q6B2_9BACL|nr:tRNA lysidine(34) synthetase TilS [Gemella bergeri]ERK58315.1 tRNA(Ile)-lysidine synthetase [Gemella bergeri ATCC 700627]
MNFNILWEKNEKIALALSGGVDSIVLFHLLVTKYKNSYKELVVFHINHGLRNESFEEASFVEKFVGSYSVKFYKKELNMKTFVKKSHISEEMLARELRYKAFKEMAKAEKIDKILTAHHKNDRVENILMRLLSGRSIDYNLSIESKTIINGLNICRPFLDTLKEELEKYAAREKLTYYTDKTNFDTEYTRNNIRHNIVPLLNSVNNASFDNLINFSEYYFNVNTILKESVLKRKNTYIKESSKNFVVLDKEKLLLLKREEIFFIFKEIFIDNFCVCDIKQRTLFKIIEDLKQRGGNKSYDVKNNFKIVVEYNSIYIHKIVKKCYNGKIELIIDKIEDNKEYEFYQNKFLISTNTEGAELGFNKEDLPLIITTRRQGDVVKRGDINKKLSRLLIDEKIPARLRDELAVVRSGNSILGVLDIGTKVNKNIKYDYYIKTKG